MPKVVSYSKNNKEFYALSLVSRNLPVFTQLYQLFYLNRIKIIPCSIYDLITPVSLTYWICGNGATDKNGLYLCTDSFSIPDVIRLMNVLIIKFNLDCTMVLKRDKYPRIYVKKNSMPRLRQLVLPYMHSSFIYKIYSQPKSL